jgi:hypothetical protein
MSAPRTNVTTETRRHRGPLIGMAVAVLLVMGMFGYWMFDEAASGQSSTTTASDGPPASEGDGAAVETTGSEAAPGTVTNDPATTAAQPTEAPPQSDGETLPTQQDVTPDPATVQE